MVTLTPCCQLLNVVYDTCTTLRLCVFFSSRLTYTTTCTWREWNRAVSLRPSPLLHHWLKSTSILMPPRASSCLMCPDSASPGEGLLCRKSGQLRLCPFVCFVVICKKKKERKTSHNHLLNILLYILIKMLWLNVLMKTFHSSMCNEYKS